MSNRNKAIIIISAVMLLIALGALLIGGWLAGWDYFAFFTSKAFFWIAFLFGAYIVAITIILLKDKVAKI